MVGVGDGLDEGPRFGFVAVACDELEGGVLGVVVLGEGYPGGYCVPVEIPMVPVKIGKAMGSSIPLQVGSI